MSPSRFRSKRREQESIPLVLALLGLLAAAATPLALTGCKTIQAGAGAVRRAAAGTPIGTLAGGIEASAEALRDYQPSEEHYIGRAVAAEILSLYEVSRDQALQDYVNLIGQVVAAAPEVKKTFTGYHFVVLEGEELQAVSTPGGFVFLTEGTVRRARDEDELASVLAHEVAHVTLNHGIKSIKGETTKKAILLLMQGAGEAATQVTTGESKQLVELTSVFGNAIGDITGTILTRGYSRESELEADQLATKLLDASGYARSALASYLRATGAEKGGAGKGGGWTSTHPKPEDRIAELGDLGPAAVVGRDVRKQRFAAQLDG